MFKGFILYNLSYIKDSSSLRSNFCIKQLIQKPNFNEIIKDQNCEWKYLFYLDFYKLDFFKNILFDEMKLKKNANYYYELQTILRLLVGGTKEYKGLNDFFINVKETLDSFLKHLDLHNFSLSFFEFRKLLESIVYIKKINAASSIEEINEIISNKITTNMGNELAKISHSINDLWKNISKLLHPSKENWSEILVDGKISLKKLNDHYQKIFLQIFNWTKMFVSETKQLFYIFKEDEVLVNFLDLLSTFEKQIDKISPDTRLNFDFVEVEYDFDDHKDDIEGHMQSLVIYINTNLSRYLLLSDSKQLWREYYNKHKQEIDYLFNKINISYQFNRRLSKDSKYFSNELNQLFKLKKEYSNEEILLFYTDYSNNDANIINSSCSKLLEYNKKMIRNLVYLFKLFLTTQKQEIIICTRAICEYISNHNDNYSEINGILTMLYEYINNFIFTDGSLLKDLEPFLEFNKTQRHFSPYKEELDSNMDDQVFKIITNKTEKIIELYANSKLSEYIDNNKDVHSIFNEIYNESYDISCKMDKKFEDWREKASKRRNVNKITNDEFPFCFDKD